MTPRPASILARLGLFAFCFATFAQAQALDPAIVKMSKQVSAQRIEASIRKLVGFGTRNTLSDQQDKNRGVGAAREWIFEQFTEVSKSCGGCLVVEKQTFLQQQSNRIPAPTTITNVVATLRGEGDPDRVYVVSGHYDSMCNLNSTDTTCDAPGANDDASGVATVLELARVMAKHKFKATLIFLAVAGEEQGLYGSQHFAEQAKRNNMRVDAMFTNDIVGGATTFKHAPDRQTVRVFAEGVPSSETEAEAKMRRSVGGENDSASRQLGRYIKEMADRYLPQFKVVLIYRRDRYLRGGDHIPFLEQGYPAVRFTETHEDYTHQHQSVKVVNGAQYGDLPEFVDFAYTANVCRVNLIALANLALAPGEPQNATILTAALSNDTDLRWDAPVADDGVGYEVVWRDTTSPYWTHSKAVNHTSYTAHGMSKDNFFFGVRSIDKAGHKSVVSFPTPSQ